MDTVAGSASPDSLRAMLPCCAQPRAPPPTSSSRAARSSTTTGLRCYHLCGAASVEYDGVGDAKRARSGSDVMNAALFCAACDARLLCVSARGAQLATCYLMDCFVCKCCVCKCCVCKCCVCKCCVYAVVLVARCARGLWLIGFIVVRPGRARVEQVREFAWRRKCAG